MSRNRLQVLARCSLGAAAATALFACASSEHGMNGYAVADASEYRPRMDEVLTEPHRADLVSRRREARAMRGDTSMTGRGTYYGTSRARLGDGTEVVQRVKVGDPISITGRIVAGRETQRGEVEELLIWDGQEEYQVVNEEAREQLLLSLGREVQVDGTVSRVTNDSIGVRVNDFEIIRIR